MARYCLRRVAQGVFVLWAAFTVTFVILYYLPSDPVSIMLNRSGDATAIDPAAVARIRAEFGFDQSVLGQYRQSLWNALHGDFGHSVPSGQPVTTMIRTALPQTLQLAALAFVLAAVIGISVALVATYTARPWLRNSLLSLPPLGVSIPTFAIGLLLLNIFSFRLGWLPAVGNGGFSALILPAVTMAIPTAAIVAQILAKTLHSTLSQPFVDAVRAKGASRSRIQFGHALRQAVIPVMTLLGVTIGNMLAGAVVIETVFARAGIGLLTRSAVEAKDIPMIQGLVVLSAVVFVLVNISVDVLHAVLDPRVARVGAPAH